MKATVIIKNVLIIRQFLTEKTDSQAGLPQKKRVPNSARMQLASVNARGYCGLGCFSAEYAAWKFCVHIILCVGFMNVVQFKIRQ